MGYVSYAPVGPKPDVVSPSFSLADITPSFGEYLGDQFTEVLYDSPTWSTKRIHALTFENLRSQNPEHAGLATAAEQLTEQFIFGPGNTVYNLVTGNEPNYLDSFKMVSESQAKDIAKEAGANISLSGSYSKRALDILINNALEQQSRQETINSRNPYAATQLTTSLLSSLADPANIAVGFVPVVGEARYARMLASASNFLGRTGVRAGVGAIEGAAGQAMIEPVIAYAHSQDGRDFTAGMAMQDIIFTATLGGMLHTGLGGAAEKIFNRTYTSAPVETPADIVDRLPPDIRVAALRSAVADLIDGSEPRAMELIDYITTHDPELAKAVSYVETLRRDGPPIDNVEARVQFWEGKLSGKRKRGPKPEDFASWVRSRGGVRDIDGVLGDEGVRLPPSTIITKRGAGRTERGVDFDDLYLEAINEGFVNNRREFIDAFKAHATGVLRPVLRRVDTDSDLSRAAEAAYIKEAIAGAGVNPNATNKVKARAIAGRELHLITAERARLAAALKRLEDRHKGFAKGPEAPSPVEEVKPAEAKRPAEGKEPEEVSPEDQKTIQENIKKLLFEKKGDERVQPEIGDMVVMVTDEGSLMSDKPVRVKEVSRDPKYDEDPEKYAGFFYHVEGYPGALPSDNVRVVLKGKPEGPVTKVTKSTKGRVANRDLRLELTLKDGTKQELDFYEVAKRISTAIKVNAGEGLKRPSTTMAILKSDYLPGVTNKQLKPFLDRMKEERSLGIEKGELFWRKQSKAEVAEKNEARNVRLMNAIRSEIDALSPNMAKSGLYYLDAFKQRLFEKGFSEGGFIKYMKRLITEGKARAFEEGTGRELKLGTELFDDPEFGNRAMLQFLDRENKDMPEFGEAIIHKDAPIEPETPRAVKRARKKERKKADTDARGEEVFKEIKKSLDTRYLSLGDPRTYTLHMFDELLGTPEDVVSFSRYVNRMVDEGNATIIDTKTGEPVRLDKALFDRPGLLTHIEMQFKAGEKPVKKAETITPAELEEAFKDFGARPEIETPPTGREALSSKELDDYTRQIETIEMDTAKRLDKLSKVLSPEEMATIEAAFRDINRGAKELAEIYDRALACLTK